MQADPGRFWRLLYPPPLLLGGLSLRFSEPEAVASQLQAGFQVLDVGHFRGSAPDSDPFSLRSATLPHGDLVISSFAGTGLHAHLQSEQLAFFVLPGCGIGHYRLLDQRMDVTAGDGFGYLPPCEFQVTNTATGGTLIGFTLRSLQRRISAIAGNPALSSLSYSELFVPRVIPLRTPEQLVWAQAILQALQLLGQASQLADPQPLMALALDDLVLRSVAMLLAPASPPRAQVSINDLHQAVLQAMDWMRAHLDQPISLSDIELQVGYGRRSLQQGFRRHVGCGPMQWLRRQRLEAARARIAAISQGIADPLSITEVAQRCGYINLSAFSRDFAALYGYPPSRMLRRR